MLVPVSPTLFVNETQNMHQFVLDNTDTGTSVADGHLLLTSSHSNSGRTPRTLYNSNVIRFITRIRLEPDASLLMVFVDCSSYHSSFLTVKVARNHIRHFSVRPVLTRISDGIFPVLKSTTKVLEEHCTDGTYSSVGNE